MTPSELFARVRETYGITPDCPWKKYPENFVLRHPENQKWFALVMPVAGRHLGLDTPGTVWVVNVKCDPLSVGSLVRLPGIFPAYHMNKEHWITLLLGEAPEDEVLLDLLSESYHLTK